MKDYDTQNDCCCYDGHLAKDWVIDNPSIYARLKTPISHYVSSHISYELNKNVVPFSDLPGYATLKVTAWNYDKDNNNYEPCPYNEGMGDFMTSTIEFIDIDVPQCSWNNPNGIPAYILPDDGWVDN